MEERARKIAVAQALHDAGQEAARKNFYAYHKRIEEGPVPDHSRADSAREIMEKYIIARGFEPAAGTYDPETNHYHLSGGCSQAAWARATAELNDPQRHLDYVAEAKDRNADGAK